MMLALIPPIDLTQVLLGLISALGAIGLALVAKHGGSLKGIEAKVDGIRDGTMPEIQRAIDQLLKERTQRDLDHKPMRRVGDIKPSIDDPATPGKVIEVDPC
jgi:hypothetical protein